MLVLRWFGAQIGTGALIKHDVKIDWPWKLEIGNDTWIGESVWIINAEPVVIGSNTCISQAVVLCSGSHDISSPTFEFDNAPIVIGDSVWIATQATILRGVRVADGATVGATALVTRDVPEAATILAPRAHSKVESWRSKSLESVTFPAGRPMWSVEPEPRRAIGRIQCGAVSGGVHRVGGWLLGDAM